MSRVAVIGSNSFSGAWFVRHCLEQGLEVLGASRSPEPAYCFLPYRWLPAESHRPFRFIRTDLNHDLDALMAALNAFRPMWVVNFAAQGMVAESWLKPEDWYQTNVVGNVRFHDRLRQVDWLDKYLHVGTPEVYGSTSGTVDETAPFRPSTPYAASRAACDLHLQTFVQRYGFPAVWTRAANVYGPGQQLYRIVPRTVLSIMTGTRFALHGGGRSVRSFIHIQDVAQATLLAAMRGKPGDCFHLSTGQFVSIRELVEEICAAMGTTIDQVADIADERAGKDQAYTLDSRKAARELGWTAATPLAQGLEGTIAWARRFERELAVQPKDYAHKS